MRKIRTAIAFMLLSIYGSTFAQGYVESQNFINLSREESIRNSQGECDSTCDVVAPMPLFTSSELPTVFEQALLQTETRTQTCQEMGNPADWIGSATQQRNYYSQNGARVPGTETPWVTTSNNCRAPYPCNTAAVAWNATNWAGQTCTGTRPNMPHNTSVTLNDTTSKTTGTIQYSCFDGVVSVVSSSCVYTPSNCTAQARNWLTYCSGSFPALAHGNSTIVNTTVTGTVGSATGTCNDGTLNLSNRSCNAAPGICGNANVGFSLTSGGKATIVNYQGPWQTFSADWGCSTTIKGTLSDQGTTRSNGWGGTNILGEKSGVLSDTSTCADGSGIVKTHKVEFVCTPDGWMVDWYSID